MSFGVAQNFRHAVESGRLSLNETEPSKKTRLFKAWAWWCRTWSGSRSDVKYNIWRILPHKNAKLRAFAVRATSLTDHLEHAKQPRTSFRAHFDACRFPFNLSLLNFQLALNTFNVS